jgi:hypothetical protein
MLVQFTRKISSPIRPFALHVLVASALIMVIGLSIALGAQLAFGEDASLYPFPVRRLEPGPVLNVSAILVAPLIETLLLIGTLKLLSFASKRRTFVLSAAAVLSGAAHGPYPLTFVATSISFFVFGSCYIAWRRTSFWRGFLAAALPHALTNAAYVLL